MEEERLKAALRELCTQEWEENKRPIFLSHLPKILKDRFDISYKLILGRRSMKSFLEDVPPEHGFRLVKHPKQKAKLCIVPSHADFAFPVEPDLERTKELTRQDAQGFFNVLRNIPAEELARLQIPGDLIVRLLDKI